MSDDPGLGPAVAPSRELWRGERWALTLLSDVARAVGSGVAQVGAVLMVLLFLASLDAPEGRRGEFVLVGSLCIVVGLSCRAVARAQRFKVTDPAVLVYTDLSAIGGAALLYGVMTLQRWPTAAPLLMGAGVVLVATAMARRQRTRQVHALRLYQDGVVLNTWAGRAVVRFDRIGALELDEKPFTWRRPGGWQRWLCIEVADRRYALLITPTGTATGGRDAASTVSTIIGRVADLAEARLEHGGVVRGDGFALDRRALRFTPSDELLRISLVAEVVSLPGAVSIYTEGRARRFELVARGRNVCLLVELLRRRRLPDASDDPLPLDALRGRRGRALWRRLLDVTGRNRRRKAVPAAPASAVSAPTASALRAGPRWSVLLSRLGEALLAAVPALVLGLYIYARMLEDASPLWLVLPVLAFAPPVYAWVGVGRDLLGARLRVEVDAARILVRPFLGTRSSIAIDAVRSVAVDWRTRRIEVATAEVARRRVWSRAMHDDDGFVWLVEQLRRASGVDIAGPPAPRVPPLNRARYADTTWQRAPQPYVGPRPIEAGEPLHGRSQEVRELYYLLSAERIVLLHAPSGAGKSSLVQAGLLPVIAERRRLDVWPTVRVSQEPPAELAREGANRYVLSVLRSLEANRDGGWSDLVGKTLVEYVRSRYPQRSDTAPATVLLVFDQFEEVLTVDPLALDAKREFFAQLGELLHDPRVSALFAMREDYLAPLDPYSAAVPTHLMNRYRIDRLGVEAAREAIVEPARAGRCPFTEPAVDRLLRDLATTSVQQTDGSVTQEIGAHVEPVQLQVTCRRLWDELPGPALEIAPEDVREIGDVGNALAGYFIDAMQEAAESDARVERGICEWVVKHLITPQGIRGQVALDRGRSGGLGNDVIARLQDAHLVRAERRGEAVWFELAHDRLIEPVGRAARTWLEDHLSPLEAQARDWDGRGRPASLLLGWGGVAAAVKAGWFGRRAAELQPMERELLARSRAHCARLGGLAVFAVVAYFVAMSMLVQPHVEGEKEFRARAERATARLAGVLWERAWEISEVKRGESKFFVDGVNLIAVRLGDPASRTFLVPVCQQGGQWLFADTRTGELPTIDEDGGCRHSPGDALLFKMNEKWLETPSSARSDDESLVSTAPINEAQWRRLIEWYRDADADARRRARTRVYELPLARVDDRIVGRLVDAVLYRGDQQASLFDLAYVSDTDLKKTLLEQCGMSAMENGRVRVEF